MQCFIITYPVVMQCVINVDVETLQITALLWFPAALCSFICKAEACGSVYLSPPYIFSLVSLPDKGRSSGIITSWCDGFLFTCEDSRGRLNDSLSICTSFLFFFFWGGDVEISLCTPISLFRPGSVHSGSASWDDCGQVFPDKLCVGLFSW